MTIFLRGTKLYTEFELYGRRIVKSTGFGKKDKDKAYMFEAALKEQLGREMRGEVQGSDIQLSVAVEKIYEDKWSKARDGEQSYKRMLYVIKRMGDVSLSTIDSSWLVKCRNTLRDKSRGEKTLNRYMAHISVTLNYARDAFRLNLAMPSFKAAKRKESVGRTKVYSIEEERLIINGFCQCMRDGGKYLYWEDYSHLFQILIDTGMRLGEALTIEYGKHIDMDQKLIRIHPDFAKSMKPRTIPMTDRVHAVLKLRQISLGNGRAFNMTKGQCVQALDSLRKKLLISDPEWVWHTCRHTCATRLLQRGANLYMVKELLGHEDIKTTEKYLTLVATDLRNAMNLLN